jgi:GIY-YIG catalytic domain
MRARKQDADIPDTSGVYQIRCKRNGKIYVGSATNLRARWDTHRRDLRKGSHPNRYMQQAWKLYGEMSFELLVLEYVDAMRLLEAEQRWIDQTGCTDRRIGFNVRLDATSAGLGIARTWYGFHDADTESCSVLQRTGARWDSYDCRCEWSNRVASRMDPRPRQEEIAAPCAQGIHRSRRRSRQNHKPFRFLSCLQPECRSHAPAQERQASEPQALDLET